MRGTRPKNKEELTASIKEIWASITPRLIDCFNATAHRGSDSSKGIPNQMTGLDIENDKIIEMACIITDSDLNILAEGPNLIINQSDELLESMSEWCTEHHGKSGLTQAVRLSKTTLEQAEYEFTSFVRQHTPPGQCPLAGNSVHADKRFLDKYMPEFMKHLHYRIIDISTIKELCRRWFPVEYEMVPQKKATHSRGPMVKIIACHCGGPRFKTPTGPPANIPQTHGCGVLEQDTDTQKCSLGASAAPCSSVFH
ncbi:small fragment nuclease isoform X4 [Phyllopteryx taeniolatus]|uniref:small fragment nuclease isoform X4 n=1 Tax=Phyllopteryx taeniolatus TaxID=161469 RepID=UPI002AD57F1D|nr:small fragment nuclease isoform X4 [Phyllopteryx taeniolatus]